jgi:hypothetical protein
MRIPLHTEVLVLGCLHDLLRELYEIETIGRPAHVDPLVVDFLPMLNVCLQVVCELLLGSCHQLVVLVSDTEALVDLEDLQPGHLVSETEALVHLEDLQPVLLAR